MRKIYRFIQIHGHIFRKGLIWPIMSEVLVKTYKPEWALGSKTQRAWYNIHNVLMGEVLGFWCYVKE